MDEWKTLAERLQWALDNKEPAATWADLGRACGGVSRAGYGGWRNGTTKTMEARHYAAAASFLGVAREWLETGRGQPKGKAVGTARAVISPTWVPVMGEAKLGDRGYYDFQSIERGAGGWLRIELAGLSPDDYAFQCFGSSMDPAIRHGWYMVIQPHKKVAIADYVSCETRDGRRMIKVLGRTRDGWTTFESINREQDPITLDESEIARVSYAVGPIPPEAYQSPLD